MTNRRQFLQAGLYSGSLLLPALAYAGNNPYARYEKAANCRKSQRAVVSAIPDPIRQYLKTYLGSDRVGCHPGLYFIAPDIAEISAQIGIKVFGNIKNADAMAIFAEKNADPFIAYLEFTSGSSLPIRARIQLEKTSNVMVVVRVGRKLFGVQQTVKVTGHCIGGGG